ncbi:MAG: hypothetical protein ACLQNE_06525 [Thermoguttaceae bacterium]
MGDGSKPGVRRKKVHHIEYVHDNPVRRGLVRRAVDWPWSSVRAWAGCEDALAGIDRTSPTTAKWLVG